MYVKDARIIWYIKVCTIFSRFFTICNVTSFIIKHVIKCFSSIRGSESLTFKNYKRWISSTFINSTIKCFYLFLVMRSRQLARSAALVRLVLYFRNGSWILVRVAYTTRVRGSPMRGSLAIRLLQYSRYLGRVPHNEKRQKGERGTSQNEWIRMPHAHMTLKYNVILNHEKRCRFGKISVIVHIHI